MDDHKTSHDRQKYFDESMEFDEDFDTYDPSGAMVMKPRSVGSNFDDSDPSGAMIMKPRSSLKKDKMINPTPVNSNPVLQSMMSKQSENQFQEGWDYLLGDHHSVIRKSLGQSLIIKSMHDGSIVAKAYCLFRGWGDVGKNHEEAYNLLVARGNNSNALALKAYFRRNGYGCEADPIDAIRLFSSAAETRHSWAIAMLAFFYQEDEVIPKDDKRAFRLYRKSASLGYTRAKHNLAEMYWEGRGVAVNREEAMRWFREAAHQEYDRSKLKLEQIDAEERKRIENELKIKQEQQQNEGRGRKASKLGLALLRNRSNSRGRSRGRSRSSSVSNSRSRSSSQNGRYIVESSYMIKN